MPERKMAESPVRTWRLRMSTSSSPIRIAGMTGPPAPEARRMRATARASSSSGEKGIVRMSSTPRSNARILAWRSPRRVRPMTAVVSLDQRSAPSRSRSEALSSWSMSTMARFGRHSTRIADASARSRAARTWKTPWLSVSPMRSTTIGRSCSTRARCASFGRLGGWADIPAPSLRRFSTGFSRVAQLAGRPQRRGFHAWPRRPAWPKPPNMDRARGPRPWVRRVDPECAGLIVPHRIEVGPKSAWEVTGSSMPERPGRPPPRRRPTRGGTAQGSDADPAAPRPPVNGAWSLRSRFSRAAGAGAGGRADSATAPGDESVGGVAEGAPSDRSGLLLAWSLPPAGYFVLKSATSELPSWVVMVAR